MQLPIKLRIITLEGKLIDIVNPFTVVVVRDAVTVEYSEPNDASWTNATTFYVATMEILPYPLEVKP